MLKEPVTPASRLRAAALQVAPFGAASIAAPLISLAADGGPHAGALALGLGAVLLSLAALTVAVARRSGRLAMNAVIYLWLASLTLLVFSTGGAGSGAALVLFVPALWSSLYAKRVDALGALTVMLLGVVAVTTLDGVADLTPTDIRRLVVFVTVPALAVWTISTLVQRLEASEAEARDAQGTLGVVVAAAQRVRQDNNPREMACRALRDVTSASVVTILEPDGSQYLVENATVGAEARHRRIRLGDPTIVGEAYVGGRAVYVPDTQRDPRVANGTRSDGESRSVLAHPFGHDGVVRGVLQISWRHPQIAVPKQSLAAVALLAQEISWSIERADLMGTLRRSATTDALTGLGNRRAWRERIPDLMDGPLCIAIADLDNFKIYNDTKGHLAGDALLASLGESWRRLVRPDDLLVRWGGEEFAIALPECSPRDALVVLERLRKGVPMGQTVSIGMAERRPDEPIDLLMARADALLYKAKHTGRDRVCAAPETPLTSQPPTPTPTAARQRSDAEAATLTYSAGGDA